MSDSLTKAVQQLVCALSDLRDDLFNQALLTRPETFVGSIPPNGSRSFSTSEMAPQSTAVSYEAYRNGSQHPMVAYVRAEPVLLTNAPNPITAEDAILLVAVNASATDLAKANVCEASKGKVVAILLQPNDQLNVSAIASAAVNVTWRVLPLRGRQSVFPQR